MRHRVEHLFALDHPTADGHFPGNPIIPGASLLSEVLHAIYGGDRRPPDIFEIVSTKFLHPVRPGDTVAITWEATATGGIKFDCRLLAPDTPVLNGTLRLGAAAS